MKIAEIVKYMVKCLMRQTVDGPSFGMRTSGRCKMLDLKL
jgi:hypothetical protein